MKIIIALFLALLIMPAVFAAQGSSSQGQEMPQSMPESSKSKQITNMSGLVEEIKAQNSTLGQEIHAFKSEEQKVYKNQNTVRLAVHALLAMENLTGGIGKNISAIARKFNNSVQSTINVEIKIQERNPLVKFFFGGDEQSASDIQNQTAKNQAMLQELKQLEEKCNCSTEIKNIIQEQVQAMDQEQSRLQQLAQAEIQNKGLLGWLYK